MNVTQKDLTVARVHPQARSWRSVRSLFALAAFLARHCHGLIALWDGEGTEHPLEGGTAQVVSFHRAGVPVPLMPPQYLARPWPGRALSF